MNSSGMISVEYFFKTLGVKFRKESKETKANYWLMAIELDSKNDRDLFLNATNLSGIMTRPIWKLMHKLPMYNNFYIDVCFGKNRYFLRGA